MTFASHHKRILASWGNSGAENETGKKREKGRGKKEKRKKGKKQPPCFFAFFPIAFCASLPN
jgi:hypothetical protein